MLKMPSQQLLLSWKDHNGTLVSVFENLLRKNSLVDCTLAAEGQYLKAHKVVLSACSSYFGLLFSQESEKNPIVILKDVKFQELKAAVNFMYSGEVEVREDRLSAFLEVADSLQIKGLGRDGKSQDSKEKVSSVKNSSTNSVLTQRQQPRKIELNSQSENAGQSSNIAADSEQIRNDGSPSDHELSRRGDSPASTFSVGTSCTVRKKTHSDSYSLENSQQSSELPPFTSHESAQCEEDPVIKTEPMTDASIEDQSDENDYGDDVTLVNDQGVWDEPNTETMDVVPTSQQDFGYPSVLMKTKDRTSENVEDMQSGNQSSSEGAAALGGGWASIGAWESSWVPWKQPRDADPTRAARHPRPILPSESAAVAAHITAVSPARHGKRDFAGKPFRCSECPYATAFSGNLKKHLRVHTGERPFECGVCGAAFAQTNDLRRHMRTHTGERPYKCDLCSAAFSRATILRDHRRLHDGKMLVCQECGKAFLSREGLRNHVLTHYGSSAADGGCTS